MAEGYLPVIEELPLEGVMKYTEIRKDFLLVPIAIGEPVRLSHVYFHQGKAILKPESYPELDRLAETLQLNSKMKIELEGHTDNVGNKSLLLKLSQDRVAEVKGYLVKKGVSRDRIKGRGYGPTRPLVPNDTDENREMNRRVEFKVLKK
jgi:outer membrane protein OmpA-like peptidoglycan-associated protein